MAENSLRQCISCRIQITRDNFIRVMKSFDSTPGEEKILINPDKYSFGRSVYLCKSANCIKLAIKDKKILKVLKVSSKSLEKIIPELESILEIKKEVLV